MKRVRAQSKAELLAIMDAGIRDLGLSDPALVELESLFTRLAHRCREARGAWSDLDPTSPEIPIREIRKQLGRVIRAIEELSGLQDSIPLPTPAELDAMIEGKAPLTEEAYVLALLQYSLLKLEAGALGTREALHKSELKNPVLRSGWSNTDTYVLDLLKAVKKERSWKVE